MALGVSTDIFTVLVLLEILIGSYRSGQRSLEGASIVGIGFLILAMTVAYEMLVGYQAGETLDLSAVIDMFRKAGTKSPQEIVDLFLKKGEEWANGSPQYDDMTFVVIKKL